MNVKFIKGEEKYIQFQISSKKKEPIIITGATYILARNNEVVASGDCTIEDSTVLVLLELVNVGSYQLEVTYTIPPETRKVRCVIDVN